MRRRSSGGQAPSPVRTGGTAEGGCPPQAWATFIAALVIAAASVHAFDADTKVAAARFTLVLPGTWQHQPARDEMTYSRGDDTVFITTLDLREPASRRELRPRVHRIADLRSKLIIDMSRGAATVSPIEETVQDDRAVSWFRGEDPRNGKRFYVAVIGLPNAIITIAFYRPRSASPAGFDEAGKTTMWSVRAR